MNENMTKWIFSLVMLVAFQMSAFAQDEVSDEEIENYIAVMAQIDTLKSEMKSNTNDLVKNNELMDKGRVFNAIKKTNGDSTAIAALEVTPEQIKAYSEISAEIDNMTAAFKEAYTSLIKDDLGASTYNKIKKGLRSDEALKARYDAAMTAYKEALLSEENEG